jgi:hypothetical protein
MTLMALRRERILPVTPEFPIVVYAQSGVTLGPVGI